MLMQLCETCGNKICSCRNCTTSQYRPCGGGCGWTPEQTTCFSFKQIEPEQEVFIEAKEVKFDEALLNI